MVNIAVRKAAKRAGIPLWRIADELQISEPTMTRKMRKELVDEERERILKIILRLSEKAVG